MVQCSFLSSWEATKPQFPSQQAKMSTTYCTSQLAPFTTTFAKHIAGRLRWSRSLWFQKVNYSSNASGKVLTQIIQQIRIIQTMQTFVNSDVSYSILHYLKFSTLSNRGWQPLKFYNALMVIFDELYTAWALISLIILSKPSLPASYKDGAHGKS